MTTTRETWKQIDAEYYAQQKGKTSIRIRAKLTRKIK